MELSKRTSKLTGQKMFQILANAKKLEQSGKDLIHFELGDPDFETPLNIKLKAVSSILGGDTHYCPSSGILELKEASRFVTERSRKFRPDLNQLLVTVGANMQIYLALSCICDPDDTIIIPNPYFPTYLACINALNLKHVELKLKSENHFKFDLYDLENILKSNNIKAIILNSPSNPTGAILTKNDYISIFELARKYNFWILSDEVYSRQIFEDEFFSPSQIDLCKERTIIINGFSKSFAMTGWRLGVMTGTAELIKNAQILLETIISCVPVFIQKAGVEALLGDQQDIFRMKDEYKKRMELVISEINKIEGLSCLAPKGALYCWINIEKTGYLSDEFANRLLDCGVVVCPGSAFGDNKYIRICYCNSQENIKIGLERIRLWNK